MPLNRSTPICAACNVVMRVKLNGQIVGDPPVEDQTRTFWSGDVWKCPGCSCTVITGFGASFYNSAPDRIIGLIDIKWDLQKPTNTAEDKGV